MVRKGKVLALACLAGLLPAAAYCGAGSSPFPFLKMPAGARSAAAGGASAALLDDAFSVFSNPAAAAAAPFSDVSLAPTAWAEGLGQETAAITLRRGAWGFGAGANMLLGGTSARFWQKVGIPVLLPSLFSTLSVLFANALSAYATAYALLMNNFSLLPINISASFVGDIKSKPKLGAALSVVMMIIMSIVILVNNYITKKTTKWEGR